MTTPPSAQDHPRAAAIETATGTSLADWVRRIDGIGGRELDHAEIARRLPELGEITEWWAQGVTVAYEQVIGRRVVGQSRDGDFSASASRTVPGDMDAVRDRWDRFMTPARREQLGLEAPSLSDTATWRYWRAPAQDGSRVSLNVTDRDGSGPTARSTLAVEHKGIGTAEERTAWKAAWTAALDEFTATTSEETR